ncbi:hypothetical protein [Rickettsiales endosymbiont of Trichoplax sp. H2]|uniref:hypothetical protein n=1 Tax=Rickettsiales endosymbiont of Trichoplax sp. H2 TaxID=2021221 RepID=UPI0012B3AFFC|nr:hypothetical protein [Rickettsiales endosymbiont of Trichoplax sp. H2]MSO14093.1 hypothetical protein [Rickettsiales endosymbiont of Trichoplax sp. H2]
MANLEYGESIRYPKAISVGGVKYNFVFVKSKESDISKDTDTKTYIYKLDFDNVSSLEDIVRTFQEDSIWKKVQDLKVDESIVIATILIDNENYKINFRLIEENNKGKNGCIIDKVSKDITCSSIKLQNDASELSDLLASYIFTRGDSSSTYEDYALVPGSQIKCKSVMFYNSLPQECDEIVTTNIDVNLYNE